MSLTEVHHDWRRSTLALGLSGAFLLWASLPPLDWWPLAWVAPIPWILLIRQQKLAGWRPYAVLTFCGFCFWMAALHWLRLPHPATSVGWVALSLYFAFYLPWFVGLSRVAVHRLHTSVIVAAPLVWTGLELARAHLLTGMTMASLGHTQYRWTMLIQIGDLAGAFGVSFVIMLVAASFARMLPWDGHRWCFWPVVPGGAVLAATLLYGHLSLQSPQGEPGPKIALIQGSIDANMQYDPGLRNRVFHEYFDLSKQAIEQNKNLDLSKQAIEQNNKKLDLIVWPEAMFLESLYTSDPNPKFPDGYPGTEEEFRDWLHRCERESAAILVQTAQTIGVPLLLGVDIFHFGALDNWCNNSSVYVSREGNLLGHYGKIHLVMFGEYVPFGQYFPSLQRLTPLPYNVAPGKRPESFDLPWGDSGKTCRIAPNICYESVLSHVIRGQVNALTAEGREPDILINQTNDGWYWGSSELDMHLACGVFRAVECRKPFLIAANTGFSAWIDADGQILKQGPRRAKDIIIAEPRLGNHSSWYLSHGDWFAGLCLAACVLCGLVGIYDRRRHGGSTPPTCSRDARQT